MSEIKTPLRHLAPGEQFTADDDGAYVIEERHTHSDLMRYIIADIGALDAQAILDLVKDEAA